MWRRAKWQEVTSSVFRYFEVLHTFHTDMISGKQYTTPKIYYICLGENHKNCKTAPICLFQNCQHSLYLFNPVCIVFYIWRKYLDCQAGQLLVVRPTQLICISDIYLYMSTYKYKRHSRAICYHVASLALPHCLGLLHCHHQLVVGCYLH